MQVAMDPHTHTFRMIIWGDMAQNPPHSSSTSSRVWYTQANSAIAWGWERGTLYNNTGRERSCWEWSGSMYMQLVCGILWRRSDMLESKGPSRHNRIDVVGWWQYRVTGEKTYSLPVRLGTSVNMQRQAAKKAADKTTPCKGRGSR